MGGVYVMKQLVHLSADVLMAILGTIVIVA